MKKLILSKTLLFIFILVFINLFISGFGSENTLIGVTVITAMLMLLERDLTISPIKNMLKFIFINVLLGILAFLSVKNIFLGILCNFLAIFIVGYIFSYDLRSPLYVAFGLQYLFMVSTPVTIDQLPMRMIALISGAVIIIVAQLIVNKNKLEKSSNKLLSSISNDILKKVELIKNNDFNLTNIDSKIDTSIKTLKKILYDNRKEDFFITPKGVSILNILFNFERISILLNNYKNNNDLVNEDSLDKMYIELKKLNLYISENSIENPISYDNLDCINLYEFYDSIESIYDSFQDYRQNEIKMNLEDKLDVPKEFKKLSVYKRNFNTNSTRFTYAFKVGLGIAIAGFIKDFFHLSEGRWIMFTVFALIQPYSEMCITKSKKRIVGTIVGCFIVFILFSIFKEKSIRGIIIILAGYTSSYTKDYRDLMICNTISAIGAICAFGPPQIFILNRFLFVILGVFIALIINKLILPYNAKNGYKSLINMYKEVISEMSLEIQLCVKDQSNLHKVKNLVLISTLIEDKIISMQDLVKDSNHNNLLRDKKIMMSNMYSLYLKLKSTKDKYDVESVITNPENAITLEKAKDMVIDNINSSNDKDNKIVYKNLLYILENNEDTKSYA